MDMRRVGVDEVGRGPLAGPVAVCAVFVTRGALDAIRCEAPFTDSKQMTVAARERTVACVKKYAGEGRLRFALSFISAPVIDRQGISWALRTAVRRSLTRLSVTCATPIFLDGGLRAPERFERQRTIPKGDRLEPAIALASVIAKVSRDRMMERYCHRFPGYGFSKHKGYGTRLHYDALMEYGPCRIHRVSFL